MLCPRGKITSHARCCSYVTGFTVAANSDTIMKPLADKVCLTVNCIHISTDCQELLGSHA